MVAVTRRPAACGPWSAARTSDPAVQPGHQSRRPIGSNREAVPVRGRPGRGRVPLETFATPGSFRGRTAGLDAEDYEGGLRRALLFDGRGAGEVGSTWWRVKVHAAHRGRAGRGPPGPARGSRARRGPLAGAGAARGEPRWPSRTRRHVRDRGASNDTPFSAAACSDHEGGPWLRAPRCARSRQIPASIAGRRCAR